MKYGVTYNDIKGEAKVIEFDDQQQATQLMTAITGATRGTGTMVKLDGDYISPGTVSQVTVSEIFELNSQGDAHQQFVDYNTERATSGGPPIQIHGFGPVPAANTTPVVEMKPVVEPGSQS